MLVDSKCQQNYYMGVDCGRCSVCVQTPGFMWLIQPYFVCITLLPKLQILKQYWVNWERNTAAILPFHFGRRWFSKSSVYGKLSNVKGQEWKATLIDSEVS